MHHVSDNVSCPSFVLGYLHHRCHLCQKRRDVLVLSVRGNCRVVNTTGVDVGSRRLSRPQGSSHQFHGHLLIVIGRVEIRAHILDVCLVCRVSVKISFFLNNIKPYLKLNSSLPIFLITYKMHSKVVQPNHARVLDPSPLQVSPA